MNEEVYKVIKMVKDSLVNVGGFIVEVKVLVVKFWGEVLYMGCDFG